MPLDLRRRELLVKYSYRVGSIQSHPIRNFLIAKSPIHMLINNKKLPALYKNFNELDNFPINAQNIPSIDMKSKYQTESLQVYSNLNITSKSSLGSHQWETLYKSMIDSIYKDHIRIFTDGSKNDISSGSGEEIVQRVKSVRLSWNLSENLFWVRRKCR